MNMLLILLAVAVVLVIILTALSNQSSEEEVVIGHIFRDKNGQRLKHPLFCTHEWDGNHPIPQGKGRRRNGCPCIHCGSIIWDNGEITTIRKRL